MAPPKGNAKKAQQKAARRELQLKKAAAKEQKKQKKQGQIDCDELPIEVLLQQLEEEQRQRQLTKTQVTLCNQPSPRAHASLTLLPSGDLLLFGGESYDGKKVRVYGDLFKWDLDRSEWRRLEAPEMPKARCAHQAVYHNDALYVFGGEFSTYYQFFHFKDFWRFDLKTNLWNKVLVECSTQVPSARSGHRMKHAEVAYLLLLETWRCFTVVSQKSETRTSVFRARHLRRWYKLELKSGKKKASKKQTLEQEEHTGGERGSCGDDESNEGSSSSDDDDENWQTTFAYFDSKGRLVKMHLEDMMGGEGGVAESSAASAHHRNLELPAAELASIQSDTGSTASCSPKCNATTGAAEVEEPLEASKAQETALEITACKPSSPEQQASRREVQRVFAADVPLPRLHGMLLVRGATLVLMGGIMELGSKEVTLDDCWTLNLNKRMFRASPSFSSCACMQAETAGYGSWKALCMNKNGKAPKAKLRAAQEAAARRAAATAAQTHPTAKRKTERHLALMRDEFRLDDPMETPAEGESLRGFFQRTKSYWIQKASITALPGSGPKNSKEMTRLAFEAASARVSLISDALRRMEELLQRQQGDFSDDSSPKEKRKAKASSRQRK
ncbi:hypothetical protein Emag_005262 [Eimeria magna]